MVSHPRATADLGGLVGEGGAGGAAEIDQVDVVMRPDLRVLDRHFDNCEGSRVGDDSGVLESTLSDDLHGDAGLLEDLTYGGLGGIFVRVDVAAGVDPQAEFVVMDQQNAFVVIEDNGRCGEVTNAGHVCSLPWLAKWATVRMVHSSCAEVRPG